MPSSADNFDLPLAKRQKRVSQVKAGTRGSKIFAPFRVSSRNTFELIMFSKLIRRYKDTRIGVANTRSIYIGALG